MLSTSSRTRRAIVIIQHAQRHEHLHELIEQGGTHIGQTGIGECDEGVSRAGSFTAWGSGFGSELGKIIACDLPPSGKRVIQATAGDGNLG